MYGAIGTAKADAVDLPFAAAVFVGGVACVTGSVLRDLLIRTDIALVHVGSFYAVAALAGSVLFLASVRLGVSAQLAGLACTATVFTIRILAVRFGWRAPQQRSLPIFRRN